MLIYYILFTILCSSSICVDKVPKDTEIEEKVQFKFSVDPNTDLTEEFKRKYLVEILQPSCNVSCIIHCGFNNSCATAIFSYPDSTCSFYNMSICKSKDTILNSSTVIFQNMNCKLFFGEKSSFAYQYLSFKTPALQNVNIHLSLCKIEFH